MQRFSFFVILSCTCFGGNFVCCVTTPAGNQNVCETGKYGVNCTKKCGQFQDSKTCDKVNGSCLCNPGYKTPTCHAVCDAGKYGQNCTKTCGQCQVPKTCDKVSGSCPCTPGYKPPTCHEVCDAGKYGQNCTKTCGQCQVPKSCDKVNGSCPCTPGYKPPTCHEVCDAGKYGQNCIKTCGQCQVPKSCDKVNGSCPCTPGYKPPTCHEECTPGTYGTNCSFRCGRCKGDNPCRPDNGICESDCEDGYKGILCQSEDKVLTMPVVGAILGASVVIALSVCSLRFFKSNNSSTIKAEVEKPSSAVHVNETDPARSSTNDNHDVEMSEDSPPEPATNYDTLDLVQMKKDKEHVYELQRLASDESSCDVEPVYQNTTLTEKHKHNDVSEPHPKRNENAYGVL